MAGDIALVIVGEYETAGDGGSGMDSGARSVVLAKGLFAGLDVEPIGESIFRGDANLVVEEGLMAEGPAEEGAYGTTGELGSRDDVVDPCLIGPFFVVRGKSSTLIFVPRCLSTCGTMGRLSSDMVLEGAGAGSCTGASGSLFAESGISGEDDRSSRSRISTS